MARIDSEQGESVNRRIRLAALLALSGAATFAVAQTAATGSGPAYPNKPIRIVVPYAAGGPIDMTTRPLAQRLNEAMGNPVVVDNRGGANGIIGTDNVAKRPRTAEQVPRALARGCDPEAGCSAGFKLAVVMRAFTVASP
jgi:hypothetical protein